MLFVDHRSDLARRVHTEPRVEYFSRIGILNGERQRVSLVKSSHEVPGYRHGTILESAISARRVLSFCSVLTVLEFGHRNTLARVLSEVEILGPFFIRHFWQGVWDEQEPCESICRRAQPPPPTRPTAHRATAAVRRASAMCAHECASPTQVKAILSC